MMRFRTPYTEMKPVFCEPGKQMKVVYELKIDSKGKRDIVKVGTTDVQAAIDAEFPSVDFNMVLQRLENGDTDALMRAEAFYADVTDLPCNLADLMQMNEQGMKIFNEMPDEYRRLYSNDYMQFLCDPGKLVDEVNKRKIEEEKFFNKDEKVIADDDEK